MELWDQEFGSALSLIERLAPARRFEVGVRAIEGTLAMFVPPPVDSDATRLLTECLDRAGSAIGGDHTDLRLPDGAQERMTTIVREGAEPGMPPLIMAVANLFGIPEPGMAPEYLVTILSDCYAAVIDHEETEPESLDEELANPRCVAAIEFQKRLISA